MGELATLAKARQELLDLYLGVPDESVNLTFEDLAKLKIQHGVGEKKVTNIDTIPEMVPKDLGKLPSLDFARGLHACKPNQHHVEEDRGHESRGHHHQHRVDDERKHASRGRHHRIDEGRMHASRGHQHHVEEETLPKNPTRNVGFASNADDSVAYDDMSGISIAGRSGYVDRVGRRRPGIPHSNICTICSTYIYIFRHRCLVCGRVYCRHCVTVGMGEMTEGRKCVECLGRRFSQRYIHRAGVVGCCSRYPSIVKHQEIKWAEKGPRGTGPRGYDRSGMVPRSRSPLGPNNTSRSKGGPVTPISRSRSPITPRTPMGTHDNDTPSFVMSLQYSPYSSSHPPPF